MRPTMVKSHGQTVVEIHLYTYTLYTTRATHDTYEIELRVAPLASIVSRQVDYNRRDSTSLDANLHNPP